MPSRNQLRIASRLKFIIGTVIQQELKDPRLGFITVLSVKPTEDYKEAKVLVSVLGSETARSRAMHALESARGYVQKRIGENVRLRNIPILTFELDSESGKMERLESLIDANRSEYDIDDGPEDGSPGDETPEGSPPDDRAPD